MQTFLVSVECAIEHEGEFLIIKRPEDSYAGGMLGFPGGKVDGAEEVDHYDVLRSAAIRETLEEVGLNLEDPLEYISSSYFSLPSGVQVIHTLFYCQLHKTVPTVVASQREVPDYYWMLSDEICKAHNASVWLKKYLQLIHAYTSNR